MWCIDFIKGDFAVGGARCYPLTITDAFSRYLIACVALGNTRTTTVRRAMLGIANEFGLPKAIRSDNGSPFASPAPAGLSELSTWWLRIGIRHERIEPGKAQQNGRHERSHRTLKEETTAPPASSLRAQQRLFDRFRAEYNDDRPHEALGDGVPAEFYQPAKARLPNPYWGSDPIYGEEFESVRVRKSGSITWNDRTTFISQALKHCLLGLSWRKSHWDVLFGSLHLGSLLTRRKRLQFIRSKPKLLPMSLDNSSPMSLQ